MIYYIRDEEGSLIGTYYYLKNIEEDIISSADYEISEYKNQITGITELDIKRYDVYDFTEWRKFNSLKREFLISYYWEINYRYLVS